MKFFLVVSVSFLALWARAAEPVAGPITNAANGHVYYLVSPDTWINCEAAAVALGGHLATINNAAEDQWVYSTFSSWGGAIWIGLTDAAAEGAFVWASGEASSYRNWGAGEPNNLGANEHHVCYFESDSPLREKWNDTANINLLRGVVEIPAPREGPSLTIAVRTVRISISVTPGYTYLLQNSADMRTWGAAGSAFRADAPLIERDVDVLNARRFFRIDEVNLTNDLVAAYALNGNANDSSGRNNHGAVVFTSNTADRFGVAGGALAFDGINSFVAILESNAFDSQDYSVSLWFRATRLPFDEGQEAFLISKGRNNFELHLGSAVSGATGIRFLPRLVGVAEPLWDSNSDSYQKNVWHHLVAIYQPSANNVRMFVDGGPLALTGPATVPSAADSSVGVRLGMRSDGNYPFKGDLDSVRIYGRALTEAEVLALFHHVD